MRVLAVDPGGTTGLATWFANEPLYPTPVWNAWATPIDDAMIEVHNMLSDEGIDLCIFESFHISSNTLKKGRDGPMDAIEFIGVGRYLARILEVEFITQSPSEAKSFATDQKLKQYGWWVPGVDHPRDASRHLMLALAKRRLIDLKDLLT